MIFMGYRIIIIIQMSLVEAGSLVGRVIGTPVSLDMKKVDGAPSTSNNKPPQQPTMMGGASAPSAVNRSNVTGTSYNSSGTVLL